MVLGFKLIRLFAIDHEGITKIKNVEVLMRPRFAIAVLLVASLGASQVISKIKLTINSHKHSFFVHYYLRCFGSLAFMFNLCRLGRYKSVQLH